MSTDVAGPDGSALSEGLGHAGGKVKQSMNTDEAFKAIQRQAPCPHDSTDTSVGDGKTWAKCYDCGVMFPQDGVMRAREAARRFDDAIEHLRALVACVALRRSNLPATRGPQEQR